MANVISYKGQKYVRVDSVRPRTRRVRVDKTYKADYGTITKQAFDALKKAGIKYKDNFIFKDDGSNYEYVRSQVILRITCLDKSPEFKSILLGYYNSIIHEVQKEASGPIINYSDVKVVKKSLTDKELYVECKAEKYLPPIDDDY